MNLRPYPEYKDSGVEWIGEIPEGWDAFKIKHLGEFKNGNGFPESLQGQNTGEIPFLKVSDINDPNLTTVNSSNNYVSSKMVSQYNWNLIPKNSIIFPKIGEAINKNHRKMNDGEVIIDNNLLALKIDDKFFAKYIFYIFKELNMKDFLNVSTVPSINMDLLKYHEFPITPNLSEQKSIVYFLDKKTSEIDKTIEKDTRLIELLQEKRTALINHVVTKGLNPEGPMKDSGIEWIGEIPEGWESMKIKHVSYRVATGKTPPSDDMSYYDNGEINWFAPGDLGENLILTNSAKKITKKAILENKTIKFKPCSVLIVGIGATIGKIGLSIDQASSNQQINAIEFNSKYILPKFGLYFLYGVKKAIISFANTSTIGIFNQTQTENFDILCPSNEEQDKIIQYLDKKTSNIEKTINKIQNNISLLHEYKKSLIHHVVTGKVDVRDVV